MSAATSDYNNSRRDSLAKGFLTGVGSPKVKKTPKKAHPPTDKEHLSLFQPTSENFLE
ncbi:UNVERIFIED_CONTAM: hypothetical protein Slati_2501800 [Sesamum latifolium]|uniref:Uncharacterized protein n=1 Tax=Sesamum latifolium TaxID=2727402 RepID=A0AAW2WEN2_9LAMI